MIILCRELVVKFISLNKNSQRLRWTDVPETHTIGVKANEEYLIVSYLRINKTMPNLPGEPIKIVCYNKDDIHEFDCEYISAVIPDKEL